MKYVYNLAFKMAISAVIALIIGEIIGINFATVGAVIAILSIQDTRMKALLVGINRIIACTIGIFLSMLIYTFLGQSPLTFGLFLLILIPLTSRIKVEEGMVPAVVLSTHLLIAEKITYGWMINELLLMVIGIGVASIANIIMPSLDDEFKKSRKEIEESYRIIISRMAKSLISLTVEIDEQKLMDKIEMNLRESSVIAYKITNNKFSKSSSYYTDYVAMRMNQFKAIKRMRHNFEKFNISVEQMNDMAEFTKCVSENITEINDCRGLLSKLNELRNEYRKMELPKTREEFESRAQLLQFLNDMEDFLIIKRNFVENNKLTSN